MAKKSLAVDVKKLSESEIFKNVSKHLKHYEAGLKRFAAEFNIKSQKTKLMSHAQMDRVTKQLKKTRADLEKRVKSVLNQEAKVLNRKVNDFLKQIESLTQTEKVTEKKLAPSVKKVTQNVKSTKKSVAKVVKANKQQIPVTQTKEEDTAQKTSAQSRQATPIVP